ncbi:hypothetical protein M9Y10_033514 [Tritrichomonas musculus]|uniref:Uncharacterized protein n=1 Tax=Tritrichomonas musculus TaxID=1915356 RepID=A0ABR2KCB7_9EUKA
MTIMNNWPFDIKKQNIYQLLNKLETKKNKSPKVRYDINVVGDIKEKVSFLTIVKYTLTVVHAELNCHTVYLHHTRIDSDSKKINTVYFIADDDTHGYLFNKNGPLSYYKVNTKQYAITVQEEGEPYNFTIAYEKEGWHINTCVEDEYSIVCRFDMKTPYTFADVFSMITNVVNFEITCDNLVLSNYKPLNLTIVDELPTIMPPHELLARRVVYLKQTGNEAFLNDGPKVTLTLDRSKYNVVDSSPVKATIENLYVYEYKNGGPNDPGNKNKSKIGMIVGIVVGVVVVIAIIIVVVIVVIRKRKPKSSEHSSNEGNEIG